MRRKKQAIDIGKIDIGKCIQNDECIHETVGRWAKKTCDPGVLCLGGSAAAGATGMDGGLVFQACLGLQATKCQRQRCSQYQYFVVLGFQLGPQPLNFPPGHKHVRCGIGVNLGVNLGVTCGGMQRPAAQGGLADGHFVGSWGFRVWTIDRTVHIQQAQQV